MKAEGAMNPLEYLLLNAWERLRISNHIAQHMAEWRARTPDWYVTKVDQKRRAITIGSDGSEGRHSVGI